MKDVITLAMASVPDRECVVAELWQQDYQFGEVYLEDEEMRIEIYPPQNLPWNFDLKHLVSVLEEAQKRLHTIKK